MRPLVVMVLVALFSTNLGTTVRACSGPIDHRGTTRVLVVGRITGIELVPAEMQPPKGSSVWYRKLVTMEVTRVYKGTPPAVLRYWDAGVARYLIRPDGTTTIDWGGGGDCSTITEDVTGRYMAVALGGGSSELEANILFGSLLMDGPTDPGVADLLSRHGLTLPSTSTR